MSNFKDDEGNPIESILVLSERLNTEIANMYQRWADEEQATIAYEEIIGASVMTCAWLLGQIVDEVSDSQPEALPGVVSFYLDMLGGHSPTTFITLVKDILDRAEKVQEMEKPDPMEKVRRELRKAGIVSKKDDEDILH